MDTLTVTFIHSPSCFRITRSVTTHDAIFVSLATFQDAIIPCVGVAVTALPGLVREAQDEVDTMTSSEDRPGVTAGRTASDRIRDILEELVEDGRM